jgi:AcrR family transcriptional regulator
VATRPRTSTSDRSTEEHAATEPRRTRGGWVPSGAAASRRRGQREHAGPVAAQTRERLISAAIVVLARDGYDKARVADIVSEAGLAHGSFYTYFESKRQMFDELVELRIKRQVLDVISSVSGTSADPIENLSEANRRYLDFHRRNSAIYGIMEYLSRADPVYHEAALRRRAEHVDRITATIERWQARGLADTDIDAHTTAAALVSMLSGFAYWWLSGGEHHDDDLAVHTLNDIWIRATGLKHQPGR